MREKVESSRTPRPEASPPHLPIVLSPGARRARDESGVVFIWVLVGLFVLAVMLVAAVQPASIVAKREREKELIFRGEAYTEAIRQYQAEHGGAFPTHLKDLIKPGPKRVPYLRRLYPEPFAKDGKWGLLAPGTSVVGTDKDGNPVVTSGSTPGQTSTSAQAGDAQSGGGLDSGVSRGAPPKPGSLPPGSTRVLPFRLNGQEGQPILGVYSKNPSKSFQEYLGKNQYNEWFFSPLVIPPPQQIKQAPPPAK